MTTISWVLAVVAAVVVLVAVAVVWVIVMVRDLSSAVKHLDSSLLGDPNIRGKWGERKLQEVLEKSGLREGEEYWLQQRFVVGNKPLIADSVLRLGKEKRIVIDAKAPLKDYKQLIASDGKAHRENHLKAFKQSINKHVNSVSKYNKIPELNSPGFSLMYIPNEPAWHLLESENEELIRSSSEKGVIVVGPTSLQAVLKIVSHTWLTERTKQNYKDVISLGKEIVEGTAYVHHNIEKAVEIILALHQSMDEKVTNPARNLQAHGYRGKKELPEPQSGNMVDDSLTEGTDAAETKVEGK